MSEGDKFCDVISAYGKKHVIQVYSLICKIFYFNELELTDTATVNRVCKGMLSFGLVRMHVV